MTAIPPENPQQIASTAELLPVFDPSVDLATLLELPGDHEERIARDALLVAELRRAKFRGPLYKVFENRLAKEALKQIKGMLRSGVLIDLSLNQWKAAGSGFKVAEADRHLLHEDFEQRDILAVNILVAALPRFRRIALERGKWDPSHSGERGAACLLTYFIGTCIWEFRREYLRWHKGQQELAQVHARLLDPEAFFRGLVIGPEGTDWPSGGALLELLETAPEQTRAVFALLLQGYEHLEIADRLHISPKAVEGSIYRFRRRVLYASRRGEVNIPAARRYSRQRSTR